MIEIAFVLTRKRARFIFPKSTVLFFSSFAPLLRPVFISRGEGRGSFKTRQPRDLCFYSRSMVFLRDIGKTFREREKISAKLYVYVQAIHHFLLLISSFFYTIVQQSR